MVRYCWHVFCAAGKGSWLVMTLVSFAQNTAGSRGASLLTATSDTTARRRPSG